MVDTHIIHGSGIHTYIYHTFPAKWGMEHMGYGAFTYMDG